MLHIPGPLKTQLTDTMGLAIGKCLGDWEVSWRLDRRFQHLGVGKTLEKKPGQIERESIRKLLLDVAVVEF